MVSSISTQIGGNASTLREGGAAHGIYMGSQFKYDLVEGGIHNKSIYKQVHTE
jgi:hypothetical protein